MPTKKSPVEPEELEFFAEEELVTIVPNFSVASNRASVLSGINGTYGPFRPNAPVQVPLWLAVKLFKCDKAEIVRPSWLALTELQRVAQEEQRDSGSFQPMPYYFMEIACILFESCPSCFGAEYTQVREQLQRVINIRRQKIEEGLQQVVSAATVRIDHLSAYESNLIRQTFQGSLNMFLRWDKLDLQPANQPTATHTYTTTTATATASTRT